MVGVVVSKNVSVNEVPLFSPEYHKSTWDNLSKEEFDVIVIGGGITGVGTALDAATRGLKVALVEARDLAAGSSSRSSKMFHGGLRYLPKLEFGLVREALHERELMMSTLAPHLVKPLEFLYPLKKRIIERPYTAAGIFLYDVMGGSKSVPMQKHLTKKGALRMMPSLKSNALIGGIRYFDTVMDDARFAMTVARTAAQYGALIRTSTQVVDFIKDADRVTGVKVMDTDTGATTTAKASVVINCTGVWTDEIQDVAKTRGKFHVRASKGVHLVVPGDRISGDSALVLFTEKSVLFVIPWEHRWIIGTTDTDWNLDLAHPAATENDIQYILDEVNTVMADPITKEDVLGVYSGLRPLVAGDSDETANLSREHAIAAPAPGLVSIAGGKYTTYRVMAKDVVDEARKFIDKDVPESVTDSILIAGAQGFFALENRIEEIAKEYKTTPYRVRMLLDRYGSMIFSVLELAKGKPELLEPLQDTDDYLKVEIVYAAAAEGALHLDDIIARRTRISVVYSHRGEACAKEVADLVAPILGWDAKQKAKEVKDYLERVGAEKASQTQTDDAAADAVREKAPEFRAKILDPVPVPKD